MRWALCAIPWLVDPNSAFALVTFLWGNCESKFIAGVTRALVLVVNGFLFGYLRYAPSQTCPAVCEWGAWQKVSQARSRLTVGLKS